MKLFITINLTLIASITLLAGCISSGGGGGDGDKVTLDDPYPTPSFSGTTLACESTIVLSEAPILYPEAPDSIPSFNISREEANVATGVPESEARPNVGNTIRRLSAVVEPQSPDGTLIDTANTDEWTGEDMVHPILISYTEQVLGDYELGDGSADIGDPFQVDDPYVSTSMDNGKSWKKERVGDTASTEGASYMTVSWDANQDGILEENETVAYPGHSHKSTINLQGDNILVAWLDKYCPSGNPYDLELLDGSYPDDYYQVNGTQGSIDYDLPCTNPDLDPEDLEYDCSPNGKAVYEVPFSCVWAARGVFVVDPDDAEGDGYKIQWRKEEQLTSGRRDANKIWIASADIGYAIAWQEDPEGLREGKGEGPGVGWSGATANHGSDIWYTHIALDDPLGDFDDVITDVNDDGDVLATSDDPVIIAGLGTKPKPAVKFAYPVRITDNEGCFFENDTKLYCADVCTSSLLVESNNQSPDLIERCLTGDVDQMATFTNEVLTYAALDGDTGASRPALKILKTDAGEYITILGYEETKGLSETDPGSPDTTGEDQTDIAVEGKMVYFESFPWNLPVTISSGNIVNQPVPRFDPVTLTYPDLNDLIFENARRLVIINQIDPCEMTGNSYTFGFMYKEGYDTQGGQSDMFIRMNTGFTWETFEDTVTGVSAQSTTAATSAEATLDALSWTTDNMDDFSGENPYDNTFSPRGFLRGDEIFTGFAYTPNWDQSSVGNVAINFWLNRYADDGAGLAWQGPQQITFEKGPVSAEDPRLIPTPKSSNATTGLESDKSNPDVWLMSYGTVGTEHDVLYTRSIDKGKTWEYVARGGETPFSAAHLSTWPEPIEEKELQGIASPDGSMFFNVWVQESDPYDADEDGVLQSNEGLESWVGRVDYNSTEVPADLVTFPTE